MKTHTIDDGGHAFPMANNANEEYNWINRGMTLRAYIATAIMAKLVDTDIMGQSLTQGEPHLYGPTVAGISCHLADALIEELNRGAQP